MGLRGKVVRSAPATVDPRVSSSSGMIPRDAPAAVTAVIGRQADTAGVGMSDSFDRIARLAATVLASPRASITIEGWNDSVMPIWTTAPASAGPPSAIERSLGQFVIDSAKELIIDDATIGLPGGLTRPGESAGVMAWAGFPVREPAGRTVGALWTADFRTRRWSANDVQVLADLAQVASSEVALRIALMEGADRAVLARTLQQILLPPRLPKIPGLQVAARHVVILAGLNQALLDWPADDQRFVTAIYATVRPRLAVTSVRISSAGHPLALIRRADGRVKAVGQPGTLLGLLPDPELSDTRQLLRPGDSMILFTDGVTEARSHVDRDFYGDERLSDLIGQLGDLTAARMAAAVIKAIGAFSGGVVRDDAVVLVLKFP